MVRTNTIIGPGCDSAVVMIKGTNKALAMNIDCNGRYVYLNPRVGTQIAVAEAARNIVCSGGKPLAVTNCLNFGNPYKPENYWQFKEAVKGMGDACREFHTPVTGGNVSFYNESPNTAVYPTPTIGMEGLVENLDNITTSFFKGSGDLIYLLGSDKEEIGGSEFLKVIHNLVTGDSPSLDFTVEKKLQNIILQLIEKKLIKSAHDISEGGIVCALAECCVMDENNLVGAFVNLPVINRKDFSFFSESQSRVIVSIEKDNKKEFENLLNELAQPYYYLGETKEKEFKVNDVINFNIDELSSLYYSAIPKIMNGKEN